MLTKFHKVLLALLAVQALLVVVMYVRGDDAVVVKEAPLLAGFDVAKVTRVQVFGGKEQKTPVDLAKRGDKWVLASGFDYPVDTTKVTDLLTPIGKMAAAEPMATQKARHKQLRVAEDDYERKLVITSDGKDTTLYIGGTAGARKTAVRISADDRVYGVTGVNAYAAGIEARSWVDTKYSDVPAADVTKVTIARPAGVGGGTIEISKGAPGAGAGSGSGSGSAGAGTGSGSAGKVAGAGSGSAGAGSGSAGAGGVGSGAGAPPDTGFHATIDGAPLALGAGETIDPDAIQRIISSVALIDGTAPADPKRDAANPIATITIERKGADPATSVAPIVLDVLADEANYWVHLRGSDKAVTVDKGRLADVINLSRDKLVKKPAPPGAGSAAPPPPGMPGMPDMPDMPPGMNMPGH